MGNVRGKETTLIKKGCPKGHEGAPGIINNLLNDLDKRIGSEVVPKGIKVTSAIEVTYEIKNRSDDFCRDIRQYYTSNGELIGVIDPINQFDKIVND